jgi:hypothetical protein
MRISCVHCGRAIVITKAQLGTQGQCPHCHGPVVLPRAADQLEETPKESWSGRDLVDQSLSFLTSMVIHMVALLIFAFMQAGDASPGDGPGVEVGIGNLAIENLVESPMTEIDPSQYAPKSSNSALSAELEVDNAASPAEVSDGGVDTIDVAVGAPSIGAGDPNGFDFGTGSGAAGVGGGGGGGNWDGMITQLRRNGLDIVIVFDSTGSMSGEIDQVKRQIERIGNALFRLVPKTRIGLTTYRDEGDDYVARGLPLTNNISQIQKFLYDVDADAGGDLPEAVDAGMEWTMTHNAFKPQARKVMLIFGDAPPHREKQKFCESIATHFRETQKGVVSTVTCRASTAMPEFYSIADAGGGEAFLTTDTKQIMTQLMVLVFGGRHREKVVEALKLTDSK